MLMFVAFLAFVLTSVGVVWFMLSNDRGTKEPVSALWLAFLLGLLALVIASIVESKIIPEAVLLNSTAVPRWQLLGFSAAVGLIEEAAKFWPLALIMYHKSYFNEHTDGIIYFAICGLTFGLVENILYTYQYGSKVGFTRLLLLPIFHGATTAIIGYYAARLHLRRKSLWNALPAYGVIAGLHGLYNFGLSSRVNVFALASVMTTVMLSICFVMVYFKATALDRSMGLSVSGHNDFCRTCGRHNLHHTMFCESCGKRS